MDLEGILTTIQPFLVLFVALTAAFLTALWVSAVIWAFRDIRARSRDIFAQILATLLVVIFFPLFPVPGLILYLILRPRETLAEVYERSLEEETLLAGIGERQACPSCNRSIDEDFVVCPACQTRLKKPCPACGRLLHLRWTVCPYCGTAQTPRAEVTLEPPPAPRPLEAGARAALLSPASEVPMGIGSAPALGAEGVLGGYAWPEMDPVPDAEAQGEDTAAERASDWAPEPEPEGEGAAEERAAD